MEITEKLEKRLKSKVLLVLKVNYFTSIFSLFFGAICIFVLDINRVIPYVFFAFGILNLANTLYHKYHNSLLQILAF